MSEELQNNGTLGDDVKAQIRGAYQNIRKNVKGFRDRPSQLKLIAETSRTLAGEAGFSNILVAEAPTGTGKSMAYLLGAIPVAKALDKRLIVSTGTVALQEQLVMRDIPSLQKQSGLEFTFILAKGRGRYACNRNLIELSNTDSSQGSLIEEDDIAGAVWPFMPTKDEIKVVNTMDRELSDNSWSGDLDDWKGGDITPRVKSLVTTDHGGCLGRRCVHFYRCAFQKDRSAMAESDVIVANHDLVMSDISLGGGAVLCTPDSAMYVFDEAHHLPDIALKHGASESRLRSSTEMLAQTGKIVGKTMSVLKLDTGKTVETVEMIMQAVEELTTLIKDANRIVCEIFPQSLDGKPMRPHQVVDAEHLTWRFGQGVPPVELIEIGRIISPQAKKLTSTVSLVLEKLRKAFKEGEVDANQATKIGNKLNRQKQRLQTMSDTWSMLVQEDVAGKPPTARWITKITRDKNHEPEYMLSCCPTSAAEMLRFGLWNECAGAVLTSATLTALGHFGRFIEKCGLGTRDGTQYLQLPSPFDHFNLGELYIPQLLNEPSNRDQHTAEIADFLNGSVDMGIGTLVLFSARSQMMDVADKLNSGLKDRVLIQGVLQKSEILTTHKERIEAGEGSIIFGLASFSEGVDLPGKLCEEVVIAKIPFAVPDSPIDATYSEWLESEGRNPFMEISVPDACIKLIQACGRLIRTETDRGRVTLLDKRVLTKRYGGQMLDSLPPLRRVDGPRGQVA